MPVHHQPSGCPGCIFSPHAPSVHFLILFFTIYGVPLIFGGGIATYVFRYFLRAVRQIFVHRGEISEQLRQQLRIPYPLTGATAVLVAVVGFISWMTLTGSIYTIFPTFPQDDPTSSFMLALFYTCLGAEVGIWVYVVRKAFTVNKGWGWGALLGGGIPVAIVTVILYVLPYELFLEDVISVTALVMLSTLVFSLYGPSARGAISVQQNLSAHG